MIECSLGASDRTRHRRRGQSVCSAAAALATREDYKWNVFSAGDMDKDNSVDLLVLDRHQTVTEGAFRSVPIHCLPRRRRALSRRMVNQSRAATDPNANANR